MNVKIDKEQLLKHHFWILSGCYLLLVIVPLVFLWTSVSGAVTKEQEALETVKKSVSGISNPKNEKWVKAYETQDGFVEKKKNDVWQTAWELQKDMFIWPPKLQDDF